MERENPIDPESVDYVVVGVGGANGWVYLGMLAAIEAEFRRANVTLQTAIKGAAGSSIGSMISVALVLQYTTTELMQFLGTATEKYRARLTEINVLDISRKRGLTSTTCIEDALNDMIAQKLGESRRGITLGELFIVTGRHLVIATHNLSRERGEMLDHLTFPNLSAARAVAMSCCIPGIFQMVEENDSLYVDAGVSNGLPIDVFPISRSLVLHQRATHGYTTPEHMSLRDGFCRLIHGFDALCLYKIASLAPEDRRRVLSIEIPCQMAHTMNGIVLPDEHRDRLIEVGRCAALTLFHHRTAMVSQVLHNYLRVVSALHTSEDRGSMDPK
jgi:hypothetical protein